MYQIKSNDGQEILMKFDKINSSILSGIDHLAQHWKNPIKLYGDDRLVCYLYAKDNRQDYVKLIVDGIIENCTDDLYKIITKTNTKEVELEFFKEILEAKNLLSKGIKKHMKQ